MKIKRGIQFVVGRRYVMCCIKLQNKSAEKVVAIGRLKLGSEEKSIKIHKERYIRHTL